MDALQVTLLVLVAAAATGVVLIRVPARQVIALSAYGLLLAILFLAFQAPDVTLSELTVGAVILPILLLLTLAKVREAGEMTPGQRRWVFLAGMAGLAGFLPVGPDGAARLRSLPRALREHHQPRSRCRRPMPPAWCRR